MQGISSDGATIGIVNSNATVGQQVNFGDTPIEEVLSLLFKTSPSWLSLSQDEGVLGYEETDNIILSIDMQGFSHGDYISYLSIDNNTSNDVIVPIIVHVNESGYLMGDLNSDGAIDILDVVRLVSVILYDDGSDYELIVSDLNQDSDINIMDAILLVQIILNFN